MIPVTFDYVANLPAEHRDKPKFAAMVALVAGYYAAQLAVVASLTGFTATAVAVNGTGGGLLDLDTATGAQLDILGQWVGQSRTVPGVPVGLFFGFLIGTGAEGDASGVGYANTTPLGEEGSFNIVWGPWYEEHSVAIINAVLDDPTYRRLIYALIGRNSFNFNGYINNSSVLMLNQILTLFPGSSPTIHDTAARQVTIHIGRALTPLEQAIIAHTDVIPRVAGVRYIVIT